MEQTQGMGGGKEGLRIREEMDALKRRCNFLEGAFTQMTDFVIDLKDQLDTRGGGSMSQAIPLGSFASQLDLQTHMCAVGVCLDGFCQEMKGAPLEFGGHSFQGLESCVTWAQTHMHETTYQCIPSMLYGLCLIHCLTWLELGGLWDLPISIVDALPPSDVVLMLHAFCKTMPTKVLLAGADLLLTMSFRGGFGGLKTTLGGAKMVEAHGPRPLSNSELGLSTPSACTAPPMLHLLDAVHKGDSQKADDAAVGPWGPELSSTPPGRTWATKGLSRQSVKLRASFGLAGVHGRVSCVWSPILEEAGGAGVSQVAPDQPALTS